MELLPKPEQTLSKQDFVQPNTHPYLLCDDAGLFISFETAQLAFDWIAEHTPNAVTHVQI